MKYQFIENEDFLDYADYENSRVYLLNKLKQDYIYDERLVVNDTSEQLLYDSAAKLPLMMSYANDHYISNFFVKDTNEFSEPFDYEVITDDKKKYSFTAYVCDESRIIEKRK